MDMDILTAGPCIEDPGPAAVQPLNATLIPSAALMFWLQPHLYGEYGALKISDTRHFTSYQTFTLEVLRVACLAKTKWVVNTHDISTFRMCTGTCRSTAYR